MSRRVTGAFAGAKPALPGRCRRHALPCVLAVVVVAAMAVFGLSAVAVPALTAAQPSAVWKSGPPVASARVLPSLAPQSTAVSTTNFPWLKGAKSAATAAALIAGTTTAGKAAQLRPANVTLVAQSVAPPGPGPVSYRTT